MERDQLSPSVIADNPYNDQLDESMQPARLLHSEMQTKRKDTFMFIPEQTDWKMKNVPKFFQDRIDLQKKKLNQEDQERRFKNCKDVDEIVRKFVNVDTGENGFIQKQKFANLHPASKNFEAILQGKGGTSVGNLTFKNCKRVSPLEKFQYRKRLNVDSVVGNKKFFHEHPYLKEFAKPGLAPGYASEALRKAQADKKQEEEELKRQQLDKENNKQKTTAVEAQQKESKKFHGIFDRFPPGAAWYDSTCSIGQLGYAKNTVNQTTFYSSAQFTTVNNRNRSTMNPS